MRDADERKSNPRRRGRSRDRRGGGARACSPRRARRCCRRPVPRPAARLSSAVPSASPTTRASASPTRTTAAATCSSSSATRRAPTSVRPACSSSRRRSRISGPRPIASRRSSSASIPSATRPQKLAAYVKNFNPRLVGLTGTPEEIAAVDQGLQGLLQESAERGPRPATTRWTTRAIIYLMDPDGDVRHPLHARHDCGRDDGEARQGALGRCAHTPMRARARLVSAAQHPPLACENVGRLRHRAPAAAAALQPSRPLQAQLAR